MTLSALSVVIRLFSHKDKCPRVRTPHTAQVRAIDQLPRKELPWHLMLRHDSTGRGAAEFRFSYLKRMNGNCCDLGSKTRAFVMMRLSFLRCTYTSFGPPSVSQQRNLKRFFKHKRWVGAEKSTHSLMNIVWSGEKDGRRGFCSGIVVTTNSCPVRLALPEFHRCRKKTRSEKIRKEWVRCTYTARLRGVSISEKDSASK